MKVKLVEKLTFLEDYSEKFQEYQLQKVIDTNKDLLSQIQNDQVNIEIINLIDSSDSANASLLLHMLTLTDDDNLKHAIYSKLFDMADVPIFDGIRNFSAHITPQAKELLIKELSFEDVNKVLSHNVPIFEYAKNYVEHIDKDLDYNILRAIQKLYKAKDLKAFDLKTNGNWLTNPLIYKEKTLADMLYWIKLYIFMKDKQKIKEFKDNKGILAFSKRKNELGEEEDWTSWEAIINQGKSAKQIQDEFSRFTNDEAEARSDSNISLRNWIKETKFDMSKPSNLFKYLVSIIDKSDLDRDSKTNLINSLEDIFLKTDTINSFLTYFKFSKDIPSDSNQITSNQANIIVNNIIDYINNESNLAQKASLDKVKFKPNSSVTFRDYLKAKRLTEEEGFREIGKYLTRLPASSDSKSSYINAFKTIWKDKEGLRKDFLTAALSIDSKGHPQWAKSLKKYIDNIQNTQ